MDRYLQTPAVEGQEGVLGVLTATSSIVWSRSASAAPNPLAYLQRSPDRCAAWELHGPPPPEGPAGRGEIHPIHLLRCSGSRPVRALPTTPSSPRRFWDAFRTCHCAARASGYGSTPAKVPTGSYPSRPQSRARYHPMLLSNGVPPPTRTYFDGTSLQIIAGRGWPYARPSLFAQPVRSPSASALSSSNESRDLSVSLAGTPLPLPPHTGQSSAVRMSMVSSRRSWLRPSLLAYIPTMVCRPTLRYFQPAQASTQNMESWKDPTHARSQAQVSWSACPKPE